MSTAIPGDVWWPTYAEQVQHLGLVEETGNQGDFIRRAYRRSSKNVRENDPKYEGPTSGVSQEVTAPTFCILMLSFHLRLELPSSFFPLCFTTKLATFPTHFVHLDVITRIISCEKYKVRDYKIFSTLLLFPRFWVQISRTDI